MASEPVPRPKNRLVTIPSPLRTLFAAFPLVTLPPGQLPARCPDEESRRRNVLYVFSSPDAALNGLPSYNPTCLKWQTFLKLAGVEFDTVGGNNHASPTGVLPFLLPAVSAAASSAGTIKEAGPKRGGGCASIPLHHRKVLPLAAAKLEGFAFRHPQARTRIRDSSKVLRAEVYQSLLDTSMRNAWLHSLYLAPQNTELLCSLYVYLTTNCRIARPSVLHSLRRAAEAEILKSTNMAVIDAASIYQAAGEAAEALSAALGEDDWFFEQETDDVENDNRQAHGGEVKGEEKEWEKIDGLPSLFDAAVFAYTHLLLDPSMEWLDKRLVKAVARQPALVKHRDRVYRRCWPDAAGP